jgi:hypothetical protein
VFASLDPGSLWHRRVNLLQAKLRLNDNFIHGRNHVWWTNEGKSKGEAKLNALRFNWTKLLANALRVIKDLC